MKSECQKVRHPWFVIALMSLSCLLTNSLSAVEISIGKQVVKDRIIFIHTTTENQRNVEEVTCTQSKTVEVWIKEESTGNIYVSDCDLKNCKLVRPDIAVAKALTAPRVAVNVVVRVRRPDGTKDYIDVGGWYVKPETIKAE